jgi:RND superfamily putative drug exporter
VSIDLADKLAQRLPVFMAGVIGLSFILLMMEFRSLFVPAKAALMNLLSIGAAYGAAVAVFQWGWLSGLLGTSTGPIESFAPMMLFAVLFGLSMDYEVFLLSRVREEYQRTGDNSASVRDGIASTARVITAAASVMIIVFLSFLLNDQRVVNLFGFGLAFAILVDATIVRLVLVPSTMDLAGRANWWMPRWLDRILPRLEPESSTEPPDASAPTTGDARAADERPKVGA